MESESVRHKAPHAHARERIALHMYVRMRACTPFRARAYVNAELSNSDVYEVLASLALNAKNLRAKCYLRNML